MSRSPVDDYKEGHYFGEDTNARLVAIMRVLIGLPWLFLSIVIISPVILILASIMGALDFLSSVILNRGLYQGPRSHFGRVQNVIGNLWTWNLGNLRWAIHGGSFGFQPLPRWESIKFSLRGGR